MLIGNRTRLANALQFFAGATVPHRSYQGRPGSSFAFVWQDRSGDNPAVDANPRASIPSGYNEGAAWHLAVTTGGLSSRIEASGDVAGNAAGGLAAAAALTGDGTLDATGSLIVSAAAAILGVGGLDGNVRAALLAAASLAGSGDVAGGVAALGHAIAALTGSGTASLVSYATGSVSADLRGGADVGQVEIATGQITAIAAAVWAAACEGSLDFAGVQRILLAVAAGKTNIDTGGPSPVVTFRDQADTTDRVTATMDGSERATVVLDPD